jgi:hypothetical protein
MEPHITHYTIMPIPPIEEQTRWFEAGPVAIGVEYRLLNDAITARHLDPEAPEMQGVEGIEDCGVSLHVFATHADGERLEHLRFDCFDEDPHYHYIDTRGLKNDMVHVDKIADGDPLAWALDRIRTRLPQMLERAGAGDIAVDAAAIEEVLPRVSEAAYRARYDHDEGATLRGALDGSGGGS